MGSSFKVSNTESVDLAVPVPQLAKKETFVRMGKEAS